MPPSRTYSVVTIPPAPSPSSPSPPASGRCRRPRRRAVPPRRPRQQGEGPAAQPAGRIVDEVDGDARSGEPEQGDEADVALRRRRLGCVPVHPRLAAHGPARVTMGEQHAPRDRCDRRYGSPRRSSCRPPPRASNARGHQAPPTSSSQTWPNLLTDLGVSRSLLSGQTSPRSISSRRITAISPVHQRTPSRQPDDPLNGYLTAPQAAAPCPRPALPVQIARMSGGAKRIARKAIITVRFVEPHDDPESVHLAGCAIAW